MYCHAKHVPSHCSQSSARDWKCHGFSVVTVVSGIVPNRDICMSPGGLWHFPTSDMKNRQIPADPSAQIATNHCREVCNY